MVTTTRINIGFKEISSCRWEVKPVGYGTLM